MGGAVTFAFIAIIATGALANGSQNGIHGFAHGFSINPDNWDQFFGSKHELPPQTLDQPFAPGTSLSVLRPARRRHDQRCQLRRPDPHHRQ